MNRHAGILRLAFAFVGFLLSLTYVIWRQSRALDLMRELDRVHIERAAVEAQRAELVQKIDLLESRTRVVAVAGSQLGMRVPSAEQIVILPEPAMQP